MWNTCGSLWFLVQDFRLRACPTCKLSCWASFRLELGIAVNNRIIIVDRRCQLRRQGVSPIDASIRAACERLRPIIMTSMTTIIGMIPLALGYGEGGHVQQPLGISVVGGLWISMSLTLIIVPALQCYEFFGKRRQRQPPLINIFHN
jgi:HAE1 family hydrophobic/amphiphilic exporter-1